MRKSPVFVFFSSILFFMIRVLLHIVHMLSNAKTWK